MDGPFFLGFSGEARSKQLPFHSSSISSIWLCAPTSIDFPYRAQRSNSTPQDTRCERAAEPGACLGSQEKKPRVPSESPRSRSPSALGISEAGTRDSPSSVRQTTELRSLVGTNPRR